MSTSQKGPNGQQVLAVSCCNDVVPFISLLGFLILWWKFELLWNGQVGTSFDFIWWALGIALHLFFFYVVGGELLFWVDSRYFSRRVSVFGIGYARQWRLEAIRNVHVRQRPTVDYQVRLINPWRLTTVPELQFSYEGRTYRFVLEAKDISLLCEWIAERQKDLSGTGALQPSGEATSARDCESDE